MNKKDFTDAITDSLGANNRRAVAAVVALLAPDHVDEIASYVEGFNRALLLVVAENQTTLEEIERMKHYLSQRKYDEKEITLGSTGTADLGESGVKRFKVIDLISCGNVGWIVKLELEDGKEALDFVKDLMEGKN